MNILHLVVYSPGNSYDRMRLSLSKLYQKNKDVKTIFISFNPSISSDYLFSEDNLFIRGEESGIPGLMIKTLEALKLCDVEKFDYVVRSNISSIVNFDNLRPVLEEFSIRAVQYAGGFVWQLNWLEPQVGIVDERYFGTRYASGTLAIFSADCVRKILRYRHFMDFSVAEDLAFGVLLKRKLGLDVIEIDRSRSIMNIKLGDIDAKKNAIRQINERNSPILWRNKSSCREHDADCIEYISELLMASMPRS